MNIATGVFLIILDVGKNKAVNKKCIHTTTEVFSINNPKFPNQNKQSQPETIKNRFFTNKVNIFINQSKETQKTNLKRSNDGESFKNASTKPREKPAMVADFPGLRVLEH